jgi:hypothetical protein
MIKASTVYDTALALAKKDQRGNSFNIEEFNNVSALVNMELYNFYVSKYENGAEISDAMTPFKVRNRTITLTAGVGSIPAEVDKLAGNPWVAHPWGVVTATGTVDVVNWPDEKVKVTSPDHGLKDGAVVTVTGLSIHTITAKAIHYIDKNSFWVDVNYAAPDVLTSAVWTVVGASYKEVDMVTEEELSVRWADHLTKPTIQNPVAVLDTSSQSLTVTTFGVGGDKYTGYPWVHVHSHGLKVGDIVEFYNVLDGGGVATVFYNAAVQGGYRVLYVHDNDNFVFDETYSAIPQSATMIAYGVTRINVYPTTIPSVIINYLRYPRTPFLDYYVDSNYAIHYLDEYNAYIETSYTLAAGDVYRDGTSTLGTVVYSWTVNWEWDEDLLPQIVYMILQKMGINLENMSVAQIATQLDVKEQSQV